MNNQEKNLYVRKQLLHTLLDMMTTQPFDSISVSDLAQRSGVGRASFYRNYTSKEDILQQESARLMRAWGGCLQGDTPEAYSRALISFLDFIKEHGTFYLALYDARMERVLQDAVISQFHMPDQAPNEIAYRFHSLAYTLFGWIDAWIRRGMPESGAQLAQMFANAQLH